MSLRLNTRIAHANQIIGDATPLPADCGKLCGAKCCRDDDAGMLLFPGEAARLARTPGFEIGRIEYMGGETWLLCCEGFCNRELRPLACRIFPLAPHVEADGGVTALPDPRARRMCPLADGSCLDRRFRNAVGRALAYLGHDPRMLAFMRRLSSELDELRRFFL